MRRAGLPGATVVPCVRLLAEIALKMPSAAMSVDLSEEDFERLQPADKAAGVCARLLLRVIDPCFYGDLLASNMAWNSCIYIATISAALHHLEAIQVVQTNYKRQLAQGRKAADTAGM